MGSETFRDETAAGGRVLRVVAGYKSLSPAESKARKEPAVCGQMSKRISSKSRMEVPRIRT